MMTEHVMNTFNDNQAPLHQLELKVDDICIILAPIDKEQGLTKNTRVRIVQIRKAENIKIFCTKEEILDKNIVLTKNIVYDEILNNF
jgi:hypothetical protein